MKLNTYHNIYFVGIGGIGMSALAKYFHKQNKKISGYDKTPSDNTKTLEDLGINISYSDDIETIDPKYLQSSETLVVYTPAIPNSNVILNYFNSNHFTVLKRSEILGMITKDTFCFAVAGTHGKTTTTSILGHLMFEANQNMTAFLGGISENYNSNLIQNGSETTVVEADEFDRSFMTLSPNFACITSMDADHLDIYGDKESLKQSFLDFSKNISNDGKLFVHESLSVEGITYGIDSNADYAAQNIKIVEGAYHFDLKTPNSILRNFRFHLPGSHNLNNAVAALAMALEFGCTKEKLQKGLNSYRGVKRRFSYKIKEQSFVFIDDYAHHPKEIDAVYQAITEMHPNRKVTAVFQPHLFSRTQDFGEEFAHSLSVFDAVLLLEIYPARELPITGINASWLLEKITAPFKKLVTKSALLDVIKSIDNPVLVTMGAGDIGTLVEPLSKKILHA
ncbi:MAG: UDP-N-acetylmuramate--L-alanine ligase [Flavobacteriaceae bacterium]